MTERERMDKGLVYDCSSAEIMTEQTKHVGYMKEYNALGLGNEKRMEELLHIMLAEVGENTYIQPRFMLIGAVIMCIWANGFMLILTAHSLMTEIFM